MAAFKYEFSIQRFHKVDAQVVGEMLEDMHNRGVEITPEELLCEARDESSPIHAEFEWDDGIAAEKYRVEQARLLISHVRIVREEEPPQQYKERGFVPIPGGNRVYVPLQTALGKEEYKSHLLKQARNDAEIFLAKYRRLEELAKVNAAMAEFLEVS